MEGRVSTDDDDEWSWQDILKYSLTLATSLAAVTTASVALYGVIERRRQAKNASIH